MKGRSWLVALCVMALMVGALYGVSALDARRVEQEQRRLLEQAVGRALATCYAVEGRYPPSLDYLEENYGVVIDGERFSVSYDRFADNVVPAVRVALRGEGGGA